MKIGIAEKYEIFEDVLAKADQEVANLKSQLAAAIERAEMADARVRELGRRNKNLRQCVFACASWKDNSQHHDRETGQPLRDFCEDVDLIEEYCKRILKNDDDDRAALKEQGGRNEPSF